MKALEVGDHHVLAQYEVEAVADVRRFPASRHRPQFEQTALTTALVEHGIAYRWIVAPGGRRRPRPDSPTIGWRNVPFRGYADHIASREFSEGLRELIEMADRLRTSIMCAEAVWWRCHRALIADALCVQRIKVVHILDERHAITHPYTSPARLLQGRLSYVPGERTALALNRQR